MISHPTVLQTVSSSLSTPMALGKCSICHAVEAKYRCSRCEVVYCLVTCFKDVRHVHSEAPARVARPPPAEEPLSKLQVAARDPVIVSLLKHKVLQVHLAVLVKMLQDSQLTNEPLAENRRELVNMRLCELRMGGTEENELVEEFVQRVLELMA